MKLGIVGLPNVGKSTLFNAITSAGAETANYPFCTIEPNVGVVNVPDERLDYLAEMYHPEKYTPAFVEFLDIAGLVKGASKGEGLGNKFLSHIREADAILHVVRCFEDDNIIHVSGGVDPIRDLEIVDTELILSDMEVLDRRIDKASKLIKGDKSLAGELELLQRVRTELDKGVSARAVDTTKEESAILDSVQLLSRKPVIYVANVGEDELNGSFEKSPAYLQLKAHAESEHTEILPICAGIEAEISQLDGGEKQMFLDELGLHESGLDRLIKAGYRLLGLISYLTAGPKEVRAWTIPNGMKAPQAAGKIHSDFERGFIRAEIVAFEDLKACGSMAAAKEKGLLRMEGKDYVMKDGDIVLFRFNV